MAICPQDCPPFIGLSDYVQLVAGASLSAAHALRQDMADISICWDGGRCWQFLSSGLAFKFTELDVNRHHAQKSHASGFCYVADCVLAILALKRPLNPPSRKPRVMYLDLDVHFSDAVSQAFYSPNPSVTPQVLVRLADDHDFAELTSRSDAFYSLCCARILPSISSLWSSLSGESYI
jgi:histone deacetylase 8